MGEVRSDGPQGECRTSFPPENKVTLSIRLLGVCRSVSQNASVATGECQRSQNSLDHFRKEKTAVAGQRRYRRLAWEPAA